MANKITVLLDLVTDKATSAAKGFKSSIADAEGAANKFKAGASSAFSTVQANAGALALGAGSALAAFGAKSIATFQDTALAAGKFSDATGIAVEDASRLQEVAGDLGVNTDALAGSLARFQKAVASNSDAVQELGIQTQHTKDGQVDVNATFLDAIDKLGGVKDANQKALLASQLFGKGFADSAELILGDADDIKKRLDEVSDAQVISDAQVERARKFRDQMDDLADKLKQVELVVGDQLVPVIGDLADNLVTAEEGAADLVNTLNEIPGVDIERWAKGAFGNIPNPVNQAKNAIDLFRDSVEGTFTADPKFPTGAFAELRAEVDRTADAIDNEGEVVEALGSRWSATEITLDAATGAFAEMQSQADRAADAVEDTADAADEALSPFEALTAAIGAVGDAVDKAFENVRDDLDLEQQLDDLTDQFGAVKEAADKVSEDGEAGTRKYRTEVRRLREMLLDLLADLDKIPPQQKIELAAEIQHGDIDELFRILGELSKGVVVPISFDAAPTPGFTGANISIPQPGQQNAIPSLNLLGLNPAPVNNSQTTIIYPVGSSPTTTFIDQRLYATRNGTNPR